MASGANALLVVRDTLPATRLELVAERDKLLGRLKEVMEQIVLVELHLAVSPEPDKEKK